VSAPAVTDDRRSKLRRRVKHQQITCRICADLFIPKRADAVTCSNKCRQELHRRRERNAAIEAELTELNRGKKPLRKTLRLRAIEATLRTTAKRHQRARGHVQRAIIEQLAAHEPLTCDAIAEEMQHADGTYPRETTRAQRVSILRAMHAIVRKFHGRYALAGGKGRTALYLYEPGNPESAKRADWLHAENP
jgi:hypothetical protein